MTPSAGARFRAAVGAERPLQVPGAICAYHAILAQRCGFQAIYDHLGYHAYEAKLDALFAKP